MKTKMKTYSLLKAQQSMDMLISDLRSAHSDAIQSGNEFAVIVLFNLLDEARKLQTKINHAADAAKNQ